MCSFRCKVKSVTNIYNSHIDMSACLLLLLLFSPLELLLLFVPLDEFDPVEAAEDE